MCSHKLCQLAQLSTQRQGACVACGWQWWRPRLCTRCPGPLTLEQHQQPLWMVQLTAQHQHQLAPVHLSGMQL